MDSSTGDFSPTTDSSSPFQDTKKNDRNDCPKLDAICRKNFEEVKTLSIAPVRKQISRLQLIGKNLKLAGT